MNKLFLLAVMLEKQYLVNVLTVRRASHQCPPDCPRRNQRYMKIIIPLETMKHIKNIEELSGFSKNNKKKHF